MKILIFGADILLWAVIIGSVILIGGWIAYCVKEGKRKELLDKKINVFLKEQGIHIKSMDKK